MLQHVRSPKWTMVGLVAIHRLMWTATGLIPFLFDKSVWVTAFIVMYTIAFLANAGAGIIWTNLMGDIVPASVRGRYFGIRNTIVSAIGSLTLFIGGQVLEAYPGGPGFHILFTIIFVFSLWNIVMFMFYPNLPLARSTESKMVSMLKKPLRDRGFMKAVLFLSAWLFLQNTILPFYSYMMLELLGIGYDRVSIITVVQTVVSMCSLYLWGTLNARYSNKYLLLWTLPIIALSSVSWSLIAIIPTFVALIVAHALVGIGTGGFNQLAFNFIIGDTPKSERPMFIAMYSAITGFATFLGPILGGLVFEWMKGTPTWVQTWGLASVLGLLMLLLAGTLGRRVLLRDGRHLHPLPEQKNAST
ncbi:MFS transporter [Paenibacillus profundus]|uniref:MFS transporter n=1 Tax=Paenibacillus profundus TaxID=1173085 RepID=A0ABS8YCF9_9BACL|nr:MFS transporter [Paenibacillus profundus]MCE5168559.1 MFS transporter [Paenibacillus profundus]